MFSLRFQKATLCNVNTRQLLSKALISHMAFKKMVMDAAHCSHFNHLIIISQLRRPRNSNLIAIQLSSLNSIPNNT